MNLTSSKYSLVGPFKELNFVEIKFRGCFNSVVMYKGIQLRPQRVFLMETWLKGIKYGVWPKKVHFAGIKFRK